MVAFAIEVCAWLKRSLAGSVQKKRMLTPEGLQIIEGPTLTAADQLVRLSEASFKKVSCALVQPYFNLGSPKHITSRRSLCLLTMALVDWM